MSAAWDAVAAVLRSCGLDVEAVEELVGGASNLAFGVRSTSGHDFVARAMTGSTDRYLGEANVMDRLRPIGVPSPEVITIATQGDYAVMVARRCPGHRLADVAGDLSDSELQRVATDCGHLLATIHSTAVEGFGNLDAAGRGRWPSFDNWFIDDMVHQASELLADSTNRRVIVNLGSVLRTLEASREALGSCPSRLAHGDFSPMNLLVEGPRVTGLVDWESAKSGPPALDFGWWDWFSSTGSTPFPTSAMLPAYRAATDLDLADLDELRHLVVLRVVAGHFVWAHRRNDPEAVERAERALEALA